MDSDEKIRSPALNKRALAIVLVVAVVLVVCAFVVMHHGDDYDASKGDKFKVDHLTYKVTSSTAKEVEVSSFDNKIENVVIPSTVTHDGVDYTVTAIGEKVFKKTKVFKLYYEDYEYCPIKTIEIPNTVKEIKKNAFYGTRLETLTIPETVKTIKNDAFYQCAHLSTLTIIGEDKTIGKKAFDAEELTSLTIPIGLNVVSNNNSIFDEVSKLTSITFTKGSGIGHDYSTKSGSNGDHYSKTIWYQILKNGSLDITFEKNITYIGKNMFRGCNNISEMTLPTSIRSIGDYAFANSDLKTFELPQNTTAMGEGVFSGCTELGTVEFPEEIYQIPARTFEGCKSLKEVALHDDITYIGDYAFKNCPMMDSIKFPKGIIQLGRSAFENTGLVKLTIPESITALFESTFKGCVNLKEITIPVNLNTVVKNNDPAFEGCVSIEKVTFTKGTGYSHDYGDNTYTPWRISKALKSVTFDDGVLNVGTNMFKDCTTLPDIYMCRSLTKIGENAFTNCSSLKSLVLVDIVSIGKNAFKGCTSVDHLAFANELGSIGKDAFKGFKFFDKNGNELSISPANLKGKSFSGPINLMKEI